MPHLLFLPEVTNPGFFLWGSQAMPSGLAAAGRAGRVQCLTDAGKLQEVDGLTIGLGEALPHLAAVNAADMDRLPASIAAWSCAAKFALDLISRGRIVPALEVGSGEARWLASLALPDDADRFGKLAKSFPLAAHAVPAVGAVVAEQRGARGRRIRNRKSDDPSQARVHVWTPDALLERFLHATADMLARGKENKGADRGARKGWEGRLLHALGGQTAAFAPEGFAERLLADDLNAWIRPLAGAQRGEARACFRLEFPDHDRTEHDRADAAADGDRARSAFTLQFLLQATNDPSLLVPAADVYRGRASIARGIASSTRAAQEYLLTGLAAAGRLFPAVAASLREPRPEQVTLTPAQAWDFLDSAAPQFIDAGLGVILPAELTRSGQRRLRMRMRLGGERKPATAAASTDASADLTLDGMLKFHWQAELGGEVLSEKDLRELAKLKAPLVQHRGRWVAVDAREIAEALRLLDIQGGTLTAHEGLAAALGSTDRVADTTLPVDVAVEGSFANIVTRLRSASDAVEFIPPATFHGALRPYQMRGLGWLVTMAQLGLGACLADDMGLGKTVQLIALLLHRQRADTPGTKGPVLLVCPTSVVGNWERELQRFGPSLPVVRHYGSLRARSGDAFADLPSGAVVLTTYGLLRRDVAALSEVQWSVTALDEAQNIKNPASRTAQAARALQAEFRVALTGTPVENRLTELWSIFEFLNPRLLGPQAAFRREFAIPIERYGQADAAERLKRMVQPFILRRLKNDPTIIQDLPSKQEMKVICSLTREQASLYQAALDEAMHKIETSEGIERRGLVLALLTALKQICNHPAQYLGESGPLRGRSGKLQRCIEMLDEVVASGDRALVFTQYREMGDRLVAEINRVFGIDAPFLHGGVPRTARDSMVQRFQEDPRSPGIFVLSVKAGGTGLNLTAANHVFHFDRWWNPAVEDQATDRAYRIGQRRSVQVHKLLCAGTVEEKVDQLLERKRDLAARIVGAGEQWITELDDAALKDLFSLAPDAVIAADVMDADDNDQRAAVAVRKRRGTRS